MAGVPGPLGGVAGAGRVTGNDPSSDRERSGAAGGFLATLGVRRRTDPGGPAVEYRLAQA